MAGVQTKQGTAGVPDNSYYKGTDGTWYFLISTTSGKQWRSTGAEPGNGYKLLTNVPPDAPSSPNAAASGANASSGGVAKAISIGPAGGANPTTGNTWLRYPDDMVASNTDYVFFQFGKYNPPFTANTSGLNGLNAYNKSSTDFKPIAIGSNKALGIILPMPQDIGTELRGNWEAKSFSRVGKTAIAALAGNLNQARDAAKDVRGNIDAILGALKTAGLNKIPGVGGNVTMNDFTGSTQGIILNPNAETLYGSPDLREIGMTFKLVPRNETESKRLYEIYQTFRSAASPTYGADGDYSFKNDNDNKSISGENFIRVPHLCQFTFMNGNKAHPYMIQYKPCAITRVQVNYTPDGTYATYDDGAPVALELQLGFQETKLIYSTEISNTFNGKGGSF